MPAIEDRRNYNMLDADLCMFVSILSGFLTRDLSDFSKFGLDAPKIAVFEGLGNAFEVFPTDNVLLGDVMVATEDKNLLRDQVLVSINDMLLRVSAKWGVDSAKYKRVEIKNPSKLTDELLLNASRMLHLQISDNLTDLTPYGLTQILLDAFEDLNQQFELAKKAQADAISLRDEKRKERIEKGNELYSLVSTYCGMGKSLYEKTNSAKYNDYIIYSPGPGSLTAPEDLSFYFPGTMFSWSPVENATSYILQASIDGVDFFEIFSGAETEFVYVPIQTSWMWFRCRAHNDGGNGNWSTVLKNGYYPGPTLPAPSNLAVELVSGTTDSIQLSFGEVPSATNYKIYRSTTNIGDVAGSFVYAGQSNTNSFIETQTAGHRYYYRCTAENPHQASGNSSQVWIDIA